MSLFYRVTEEDAVNLGLTHEGTVYGIPAWLKETPDRLTGITKVYALRYVWYGVDAFLRFAAWLSPFYVEIKVPFKLGRRLPTKAELAQAQRASE